MTDTIPIKPATKRPRKMAREPNQEMASDQLHASVDSEQAKTAPTNPVKPKSKTELVLDLLRRPTGASIDELIAATGWLPHTTRAALTGIKKKGHALISVKVDGTRRYRIEEPAA